MKAKRALVIFAIYATAVALGAFPLLKWWTLLIVGVPALCIGAVLLSNERSKK